MKETQIVNVSAWGLVIVVSVLALLVWLQSFTGMVSYTGYTVFPLLGIVAFSLMWTHYIVGSLRRFFAVDKKALKQYHQVTSWLVLLCILLHPGLLILSLWKDGLGLPPSSYLENYVAPGGKFAVMLGSISLVIFLLFELKKKFGSKSWWKFIEYGQIVAMIAIFIHALQLGGELDVQWFRAVWFFYGITFVAAAAYNYFIDSRKVLKNK